MVRHVFAAALVLSLRSAPADAQVAQPAPASTVSSPRRFDAEARFMFWHDSTDQSVTPARHQFQTDFLLRRARAVIQVRVSESLTATIQAGQDNMGARFLVPDRGIAVKDMYINYRAANAFQVAAGQFKVPFLRANLESGFTQLLVDRGTLPTLRPAREGSRDIGVMAWGNVQRWQYRVAAFDGSDQDATARGSLRLTARVAKNWFTAEPGLVYTGTNLGTARVLHIAAQADIQASRVDARDEAAYRAVRRDYRSWAVEVFWEQPLSSWAVTADAAWFDRRDDYLDAMAGDRHSAGYHAQGGLLLPRRLAPGRVQVALRREAWTTERDVTLGGTSRTAVGGTYYFNGRSRKIQADYTVKREVPELSNDEFRASYVVVF